MNHQKKNRKPSDKRESQVMQLSDGITTIFLLYMCAGFPFVMHNGYLDITLTRFRSFEVGVIAYGILFCLAGVLWLTDRGGTYQTRSVKNSRNRNRQAAGEQGKYCFLYSDLWFGCLLLFGFIAWALSNDKTQAFTGEAGRRCGFAFFILVCLMYICLGSGYRMRMRLLPVAAVVSDICFLMSVLQHLNIDIFHLLAQIREDQRATFISTFGNINIFASFVGMAAVCLMGVAMSEHEKRLRALYGASIFLAGGATLVSNSDGVYLGLFVGILALGIFAVYQEHLFSFFKSVVFFAWGYTCMTAATVLTGRGADKLSGIASVSKAWYVLLAVCAILTMIGYGAHFYSEKKRAAPRKKTIVCGIFGGVVLAAAAICNIGIKQNWQIFTFDDAWGDYRGYVWTRLARIYRDLPFVNQIFGTGQESIYALMSADYAEEMVQVTGTVYDSAHNAYLQYLITTGFCGLIAYLGVIVSSIQNSVRLAKTNRMGAPLAAGLLAYAAQSLVNVEQPITTPFFFLGAALAAGLYRRTPADASS